MSVRSDGVHGLVLWAGESLIKPPSGGAVSKVAADRLSRHGVDALVRMSNQVLSLAPSWKSGFITCTTAAVVGCAAKAIASTNKSCSKETLTKLSVVTQKNHELRERLELLMRLQDDPQKIRRVYVLVLLISGLHGKMQNQLHANPLNRHRLQEIHDAAGRRLIQALSELTE